MPIDPDDFESDDLLREEIENDYEPDIDDTDWSDEDKYRWWHEVGETTTNMKGTSMDAPFMMMMILQIRSVLKHIESQGVSKKAIRAALYCLLRIDLSGKIKDQPPGSDESWLIALEDTNSFNDVADCLFAAYAKDRSLCREGLVQTLTGDNFSITLDMSSPNSSK